MADSNLSFCHAPRSGIRKRLARGGATVSCARKAAPQAEMIILDTNVISEFTRRQPSGRAEDWFRRQDIDDLATTAVAEGELYAGVEAMPDGRRKLETARAYDVILGNLGG